MSELPPDPKARLMAAIQSAPSQTRRAARVWQWLIVPAGAIIASALYFAYNGPDQGQGGRDLWYFVASVVSWTAIAVLSLWGALGRGRAVSWRSRASLLAFAVGTPLALFAVMFSLGSTDPDMAQIHPEKWGRMCLPLTLAAAAFPLLALLYARRESDPVHPAFTGAALGSACGAAAGIMVELWCPVSTPKHIALGHILPIGVLAVMGALLGSQMLGLRRPPRR